MNTNPFESARFSGDRDLLQLLRADEVVSRALQRTSAG